MKCPVCNGTGEIEATRAETIVHMVRHSGKTYQAIADEVGLKSVSTVHYHANKAGIKRNNAKAQIEIEKESAQKS